MCPVCGNKLDGKKESYEHINKDWEYTYSKRDIEVVGHISLQCKCGGLPYAPIDKFEILTPEKCKLKEGETIECNEEGCHNILTSDYIVMAEAPIEPENNYIKCPTCGSIEVKKIGLMKKTFAFAMLDFGAAGYVSKTFHCNHCGFNW